MGVEMNETKRVELILTEVDSNHNKYWRGILFDNGDVRTEWGRVGYDGQSKDFPGRGQAFLESKIAEKTRKGYTPTKTINGSSGSTTTVQSVGKTQLNEIARKQIQTTNPTLTKFIDRLVQWNIHQITSQTKIQYNSSTGAFTTPLGLVTQDAIDDARNTLASIQPFINRKDYTGVIPQVNKYLRLIPHDVGMKLRIESLFPDVQSVRRENDILDSLEASLVQSVPAPKTLDGKEEKVFSVKLDIVQDQRERDRISKKYLDTRKDMHVCAHLKVKEIYSLEINHMATAFQDVSPKIGFVKELWHGTKKANLLSILKSGLRVSPPSTAAIAGKMFGNGVYFAHDSTKSLNYSYGYWDGTRDPNCFMFLANVALGKYYVPRNGETRLPSGYDSFWAKSNECGLRNDEYIIFKESQCNLVYLVEFN